MEALDVNEAKEPSAAEKGRRGELWRSTWRTHFYAAIIAFPVMAWFAISGLVIIYQQPLKDALHPDLRHVTPAGRAAGLEAQLKTAEQRYPSYELSSVTPPSSSDRPTVFSFTKPDGGQVDVYVDGYRNVVLGSTAPGASDLTDFARSYHGSLLPRSILIPMPALAGLLGSGAGTMHIELGEVLDEIFAGWGLVLAVTGLYLWLPRRRKSGKAMFVPKLGRRGRPLWRDLHAVVGWFLAGMLLFFVITGLPWSSFWGQNWATFAAKATPNQQVDFWSWEGPTSKLPKLGDVSRDGTAVPWAGKNDVLPVSKPPAMPGMQMGGSSSNAPSTSDASGNIAKVASLDAVARAARDEGMHPGYTITPPNNTGMGTKHPRYGVWVLTNPWPSSLSRQGAVYLNEFTAVTLARSDTSTWGFLQRATELGVQTHMGTQFGLLDRIVLTLACVATLWSIVTGALMWNARRRSGTLGIPRRPVDPKVQRATGIAAIALAIIYPLWGCSLLLVLVLDRFVVRRSPLLQRAFGMASPNSSAVPES